MLDLLSRCSPPDHGGPGAARRAVAARVRQRLAYHLAAYQLAADAAHLDVQRRDWMCRAVLEASPDALAVLAHVLLDELAAGTRAAS